MKKSRAAYRKESGAVLRDSGPSVMDARMNDAPVPTGAAPAPHAPSRRRKKRKDHGWGRRLAWVGAGLLVLGLGAVFSLRAWVEHYLKSAAFTSQFNAAAGRALDAECAVDGMSWQGATGYAATFRAQGRESAAFRAANLADLRVDVDLGAVWDRVWRIRQVRISRMAVDFSSRGRATLRAGAYTLTPTATPERAASA